MRKILLAAALVVACSFASAIERKCRTDDLWRGPDKTKHMLGGAAIASAVTLATKEPHWGFAAGLAVGAAKEIWDRRGSGTCSFQDFAVTAGGAAAGAYGTAWLILPQRRGVAVAYVKAF
ncbi:MAG: hypothetical protein ACT6S0_04950 [Roseateles sp.]|uniref:hypothetical protein n=1 Tax=Roseateles sp. TaxID=1971397 RepID=UPI004036C170